MRWRLIQAPAVCQRASSRRPGSTDCPRLLLSPSTETSSPPILQSWNVRSPISAGRLKGSPAACWIREMQLWISDNVSSTCWRPHNSGHSVVSRRNNYRCQMFLMAVLKRVLSLHQPSQSRKPSQRLRSNAVSASCLHIGMTNSMRPSYQCSKRMACCKRITWSCQS